MDDLELREEMEKNKSMGDIEGVVCNDPDCCCNNGGGCGEEGPADGEWDGSMGQEMPPYHELNGKVLIIRVGSEDRPATPEDIEDVNKTFTEGLKGIDCKIIVTHHLVKIQIL